MRHRTRLDPRRGDGSTCIHEVRPAALAGLAPLTSDTPKRGLDVEAGKSATDDAASALMDKLTTDLKQETEEQQKSDDAK